MNKPLLNKNRNGNGSWIPMILIPYPEISDANFKRALWTFKQQLAKMRARCRISIVLVVLLQTSFYCAFRDTFSKTKIKITISLSLFPSVWTMLHNEICALCFYHWFLTILICCRYCQLSLAVQQQSIDLSPIWGSFLFSIFPQWWNKCIDTDIL